MRVIDFFAHPVLAPDESSLFQLDAPILGSNLEQLRSSMRSLSVDRCLLTLFTSGMYKSVDSELAKQFVLSPLAEFNIADPFEALAEMADRGIHWITFHPYLQKITRDFWKVAVEYAVEAERLGINVNICTAYGSQQIYSVEVLPFAATIAEAVSCPVVFVHGGGAKVLDALLIADAYPNVFLDTSFSLSYWVDSSIDNDIAFAIRKLGYHRWLFGSDTPFVPMSQAISDHQEFFERHKFKEREIEAIMGENAINQLGFE